MLSARDGGADASLAVLLEDGAQARQAVGETALEEPAAGEELEQPVAREGGLRLHLHLDAGRAARRLVELVLGDLADAVELAAAAVHEDPVRRLRLDDRRVGPAEADERGLDAEPHAGADPLRLLARQVPVLQEVVEELRVAGHVDEVGVDLLAGLAHGDGRGDGIHPPQSKDLRRRAARAGPGRTPPSGAGATRRARPAGPRGRGRRAGRRRRTHGRARPRAASARSSSSGDDRRRGPRSRAAAASARGPGWRGWGRAWALLRGLARTSS